MMTKFLLMILIILMKMLWMDLMTKFLTNLIKTFLIKNRLKLNIMTFLEKQIFISIFLSKSVRNGKKHMYSVFLNFFSFKHNSQ